MRQEATSTTMKFEEMPTGLYAWLAAMGPESTERLRIINANSNSSKHVIIALTFGLYDANIRRLNRIITHLLVARLKAERRGDAKHVARINELMEEMHVAIDRVTGVDRAKNQEGGVCNRPRRSGRPVTQ